MPTRLRFAHLSFGALIVATFSLASLAVRAQPPTPATKTVAKKQEAGEPGAVNLDRSRVYIFVGKKGRFGHEHGVIGRLKSGRVSLGALKDAGELTFDMTSFVADTKEARRYVGLEGDGASMRDDVTKTMLSSSVLSVKQHPTAKFVIKSAKEIKAKKGKEAAQYQLVGEFTLLGATRPLSLVALGEEYEGEMRVRGNFTVLQTEYGMRPYSTGFGAVGVSDQLKIWGDLLIKK